MGSHQPRRIEVTQTKKAAEKAAEKAAVEAATKSGKSDAEEATDAIESSELRIEEDRRRLTIQGIGYLAGTIACLVLCFLGIDFGIQGLIWAYLGSLVAIAGAWFMLRPAMRLLGKLIRRTGVADFCQTELLVHVTSGKDDVIPYVRIRSARIVREDKAIRLLLSGGWVQHPSGLYYVGIDYPFQSELLDGVERSLRDELAAHHVKVEA